MGPLSVLLSGLGRARRARRTPASAAAAITAALSLTLAAAPSASAGICGTTGVLALTTTTATCTFTVTGNSGGDDAFEVPAGITAITVVANGGAGGSGRAYCTSAGGLGAQVTSTFAITEPTTLALQIAGNGGTAGTCTTAMPLPGTGGYGGGGNGGIGVTSPQMNDGGGGGGATRVTSVTGSSVYTVAGGGGGGGSGGSYSNGGNAGAAALPCLNIPGNPVCGGGGGAGTLTAGGALGTAGTEVSSNFGGSAGSAGQGGDGMSNSANAAGGGGGGGVYGGGGGQGSNGGNAGGGGGGSSDTSGSNPTIALDSSRTPKVQISWTRIPVTPSVSVRDQATAQPWTNTELGGSKAYAASALSHGATINPTGTVTYRLYTNGSCSSASPATEIVTVGAGGAVPDSSPTAPLGLGTKSYKASYSGDNYFAPADSPCQSFTVSKLPQAITWSSTAPTGAAYRSGTYTPSATGGASGNPVTFSIAAASFNVCSISAGVVSFIGGGTCTIQANQAGDTNYADAPQVTQSFSIAKATLRVDALPLTTPYGTTPAQPQYQLRASDLLGTDNASNIGLTGQPDCLIAAHSSDVGVYAGAITCVPGSLSSRGYTIVAGDAADHTIEIVTQTVAFTSTAPTAARYGGTYTPSATGGASGNPVVISTAPGDADVCTTSGGIVSFVGVGSCEVRASQAGGTNYTAAPLVTQVFDVDKAIVRVDADPLTVTVGAAEVATATLRASDFVGSDTPANSSVTGAASCSIAAHAASAGTYAGAVTCTPGTLAAPRYTFVAGTAADLTLQAPPSTGGETGGGTGGGSTGGGATGGGSTGGGSTQAGVAAVTLVRAPAAQGNTVTLQVRCPAGSTACSVATTLATTVKRRRGKVIRVSSAIPTGSRRAVITGRATTTIAAGQTATITVKLGAQGRKLLKQFGRLPVRVTVTATLAGATRQLTTQTLTIRS